MSPSVAASTTTFTFNPAIYCGVITFYLACHFVPFFPRVNGRVVEWLLNKHRHTPRNRPISPVYIGDDLTDEDAFKILKKSGLTIVVGKTKLSNAEYYVYDTKQVAVFLEMMPNAVKKLPLKTKNY